VKVKEGTKVVTEGTTERKEGREEEEERAGKRGKD
jgi:hypothetical protein